MILDLYQIFRARKDPPLATKLAVRLAQGQLIERMTAPVLLIHILLWMIAGIGIFLSLVLLWAALTWHGVAWVLFPLPTAPAIGAIYISLGLKRGLDHIKTLANSYSDKGVERVMAHADRAHADRRRGSRPAPPSSIDEPPSPPSDAG